jgi:hypothetical protein
MKQHQFRINKYREMNNAKPLAYFAIAVGFMLFLVWTYILIKGAVPGYSHHPTETTFHLVVEYCTAIMLIISGLRVLLIKGQGEGMLLLSMGMLFYTLVNSTGYFIDRAGKDIVIVYLFLLAPAIYFTVFAFHGSRKKS